MENVTTAGNSRFNRGATRLGLMDVLTALILLGVLLYASWRQFPAFNRPVASPVQSGSGAGGR
ncbi:MAG: hypothetical protein ABSD31_01050 [Candidatus Binataceae bacterium]